MAPGTSDQYLVERAQNGDRRAFDVLVRKYQQKIVSLVTRYVRDPADALDVAQEAFIKAWRALPGFRGESAFYTWLYRIAINAAKNHLASVQRRPLEYHADPAEDLQYEARLRMRDEDTPERINMRDELRDLIGRTISELPEELRSAIVLREVEGMSYEEIAAAMGCPIGTVRSRIFRAREAVDAAIRPLLGS